jgi:hypothetical protein
MGLVGADGKPTHNSESLIGTMNGVFQVRESIFHPGLSSYSRPAVETVTELK